MCIHSCCQVTQTHPQRTYAYHTAHPSVCSKCDADMNGDSMPQVLHQEGRLLGEIVGEDFAYLHLFGLCLVSNIVHMYIFYV